MAIEDMRWTIHVDSESMVTAVPLGREQHAAMGYVVRVSRPGQG